MELPLCHQTVTVYHRENEEIRRRGITGCDYDWKQIQRAEGEGIHQDTVFLLILPAGQQLEPGDRIYEGIGPEQVDWVQFVPALVKGLSQASWVRPCFVGSSLHHTEAGNN